MDALDGEEAPDEAKEAVDRQALVEALDGPHCCIQLAVRARTAPRSLLLYLHRSRKPTLALPVILRMHDYSARLRSCSGLLCPFPDQLQQPSTLTVMR